MIPSPPTHPSTRRVLLTGFGPFPTVPDNASGSLVTALAGHPELGASVPSLKHVVLPTSWTDAPRVFASAIAAYAPDIVISFGVSKSATGFTFETLARNIAAMPDVNGHHPSSATIDAAGRRFVTADLPARHLVKSLRAHGYPATRSLNAGRYLCNTLLFEAMRAGVSLAGFVHLPARLAGPDLPGVPPKLDWPRAVSGGVMLVQSVAQHAAD
jgi:pyroglutamyl-peptidase